MERASCPKGRLTLVSVLLVLLGLVIAGCLVFQDYSTPLNEENEWEMYSLEISTLLPQIAHTARRSSPEDLVANIQALKDQQASLAAAAEASVKQASGEPLSAGIDTSVRQEGTSVKLQKLYKLSNAKERAEIKRRPKGDHGGADIGRAKEEEPKVAVPKEKGIPLSLSDKMLLEHNGVWEGIRLGVSIISDSPVWAGEPAEYPVVSPGPEDKRTEIFECDRSNPRSDVCTMRGRVQLYAASTTFQMFVLNKTSPRGELTVTPYARKAKGEVPKGSVTQLEVASYGLKSVREVSRELDKCNRNISVPAVVFSIGGKSDDYFYAMEDTVVPLILTSFKYEREVVFFILDWHEWWLERFWGVLKTLSRYPPVLLGEPGQETDRDREHARVKRMFGVKVDDEKRPVKEVKSHAQATEAPKAVFEKPEDLLSLLSKRRKLQSSAENELEWDGRLGSLVRSARERQVANSAAQRNASRRLLWWGEKLAERMTERLKQGPADEKLSRGTWEAQPIPGAKKWRAEMDREVWPEVGYEPDQNVYCLSEVIIGLTTHGNLRTDPSLPPYMEGAHFTDRWKALVHPRYAFSEQDGALLQLVKNGRGRPEPRVSRRKPKLGLTLRSSPERRIINEEAFIFYAQALGFEAVIVPEFVSLEDQLVIMQDLDVLAGVLNSQLSNFLFMRKGSVVLQIAPFSTDWHADHNYGQGVRAKGLKYIEYQGSWWESSLQMLHDFDDDVRKDANAVYQKYGFEKWRDIYMGQSIWLEDSKVILALRLAKKYLLRQALGPELAEDPPVPEYVQGDFYFEW